MSVDSAQEIVARIIEILLDERAALERRAVVAAESATHEESRPEDPKDTRGLEESYLAHGLALRARRLDEEIRALQALNASDLATSERVRSGSRLTLEDEEGNLKRCIMLPCAGGLEVEHRDGRVVVITPSSPMGQALLVKELDDEIEVRLAGQKRVFVLAEIG